MVQGGPIDGSLGILEDLTLIISDQSIDNLINVTLQNGIDSI